MERSLETVRSLVTWLLVAVFAAQALVAGVPAAATAEDGDPGTGNLVSAEPGTEGIESGTEGAESGTEGIESGTEGNETGRAEPGDASAESGEPQPVEIVIEHERVSSVRLGRPVPIAARIRPALGAHRLLLAYQVDGAGTAQRVRMQRVIGNEYYAEIPAALFAQGPVSYRLLIVDTDDAVVSRTPAADEVITISVAEEAPQPVAPQGPTEARSSGGDDSRRMLWIGVAVAAGAGALLALLGGGGDEATAPAPAGDLPEPPGHTEP